MLHIPRNGSTHADSLATLATSSTQGLPQVILVKDLCKPIEGKGEMVHVHQIRVGLAGWNLYCYSLRRISCPRISQKLISCEGRLLSFGYSMTKNCTNALSLGRTCSAYTLRRKIIVLLFLIRIDEADEIN